MLRAKLEARHYILLLPILFGLLASCFANTPAEPASQDQSEPAGLPTITVFKAPT